MTWGATFFIQGQGTVVEPGKEHTYVSNLRAPSTPGQHVFQWRLSGDKGLFGEPTAKREITVVARKTQDDPPPALPKADANGKRPLTPADVEYLGSFKLPTKVGKGGAAFDGLDERFHAAEEGAGDFGALIQTRDVSLSVLLEVELAALPGDGSKDGLDGGKSAARLHGVHAARRPPATDAHLQCAGTRQPGTQAPHPCRPRLPQ